MKKLLGIVVLALLFNTNVTNFSNSEINPPFKNMSISKYPIEYKDILFNDYEGNTINLKDQNSKIYMLNFWATWCLPCKEEMPYLDKLQNVNGIKIFPINIEKNREIETKIFFKNLEIKNLTTYFDIENNLVNLFRLRGLPTTIILNKDNKFFRFLNKKARKKGINIFSFKRFK